MPGASAPSNVGEVLLEAAPTLCGPVPLCPLSQPSDGRGQGLCLVCGSLESGIGYPKQMLAELHSVYLGHVSQLLRMGVNKS